MAAASGCRVCVADCFGLMSLDGNTTPLPSSILLGLDSEPLAERSEARRFPTDRPRTTMSAKRD